MKNYRKRSNKKQKLYKMRGCSKTCKRKYRGGSADVPLAYPADVPTVLNPHLAYTGKGGSNCSYNVTPENISLPQNINGFNPAYPNTGPIPTGFNFLNSTQQLGGACGTCSGIQVMSGGKYMNGSKYMTGGKYGYGGVGMHMNPACPFNQLGGTHRNGCKCSNCKHTGGMRGGNAGIPYPNGLVGSAWTADNARLPGANGIPGDSNYYKLNTYNNDVSRQMVDLGAAPPFTGGRSRKNKKGGMTPFFGQDLINIGRQIQYGIGSAYNAIQGYSQPVNPLPWKDQIPNNMNSNTVKMLAV
jgi:hypothetical protein